MTNNQSISIFIHIYYEDTIDNMIENIRFLMDSYQVQVYFNVCLENFMHDDIIREILSQIPDAIVLKSTNKGKDVGGKLLLMDAYMRLGLRTDFILFLHDKKSPQLVEGTDWKNELFHITKKEVVKSIFEKFKSEDVGMVGRKEYLLNKRNNTDDKIFAGARDFVLNVANEYNLVSKDFGFVGGTMFWVRAELYEYFFTKWSPLMIRQTLEEGNVMDDFGPTYTHTWERLLGWVIGNQDKQIVGI